MSKPAEVILAAYETDYLKEKMFSYPASIFDKKRALRALRDNFSDADQARALLEANMMSEISDETDSATGKAKYSNEKAREAELIRRKTASVEYQSAMKELRKAGHALSEAQDELEMLQDAFKSTRYVARLVSEELALMASEDTEQEEPLTKAASAEPF